MNEFKRLTRDARRAKKAAKHAEGETKNKAFHAAARKVKESLKLLDSIE